MQISREDIADLLGDVPTAAPVRLEARPIVNRVQIQTRRKGDRSSWQKRLAAMNAIAESAYRCIIAVRKQRLMKDIEDLMGKKKDSNGDIDDLMGGDAPKKSKKDKAAKKAAKPEKVKPAKKEKGGDRNARGEGKFYFPKGSDERESIKKRVLKSMKSEAITATELATQLELPSWKVRHCMQELGEEKLVKLTKINTRIAAAASAKK